MRKLVIIFLIAFIGYQAIAQTRRYSPSDVPRMPRLSSPKSGSELKYDVGASSGTYNGDTYTEVNLGLNWQLGSWFVWRNAAFQRFGSGPNSVTGIDTSFRIGNDIQSDGGGLGMNFYIGPGLRFATNDASAGFAEAGIGFRLGGIFLGVGAKAMQYFKTRTDDGKDLPKSDNQVFFVLGGGGTL
jgi:hypothetical protein